MIICNSHQSNKIYLIFESFIPLSVGGLIYILFRTDSLFMYRWFDFLNISGWIYSVRNSIHFIPQGFIKTIIDTVPNGLWMFSYIAFLLLIWKNEINKKSILYFLLLPVISVMSEFLQKFGIINGTFDVLDIFSYTLGAVFPLLIHFKKIKLKIL